MYDFLRNAVVILGAAVFSTLISSIVALPRLLILIFLPAWFAVAMGWVIGWVIFEFVVKNSLKNKTLSITEETISILLAAEFVFAAYLLKTVMRIPEVFSSPTNREAIMPALFAKASELEREH